MFDSIIKFLKGDKTPKDGLTQQQREAIVDLLIVAMYADKNSVLAENDTVVAQIEKLAWDSGISIELYIDTSTSRVRNAIKDEAGTEKFILEIGSRLETREAAEKAMDICSKVVKMSGKNGEDFLRKTETLLIR